MTFVPVGQESSAPVAQGRATLLALIVDDEEHVRNYLRALLEELGVTRIAEALDGRDGWERIQRQPPDAVFLDVNMPGLSGVDVMRRIAQLDAPPSTVIVTSNNDLATVREFQALGASGYILKNLPRRVVLTMLESAVDDVVGDAEAESD